MESRKALKAAAAVLAGAGFTSISNDALARPKPHDSSTKRTPLPYLETGDRATLFYKDWGPGEPKVVFVHGWPFHSDMWQYQMLHLASAGVRVIAYDQRGCGRSTDPGTGYDFDTLADDLASVIQQLGLRKVVLVGHSIGTGQIVRYLTGHGSDRVSGIVLLSASLPFIQRSPANPDGVDPADFEHWRMCMSSAVPAWLGRASKTFAPEASPETQQWVMRTVEENSIWAVARSHQR